MRALAAAMCALVLAGCASAACDRERLPDAGRATSPEALFRIAQHAGREECGGVLHGLLGPRTREKIPAWKFRAAWDSDELILYPRQPIPEAYEGPRYTLAEVIQGAELAGVSPEGETPRGLRPGQRLLYLRYQRGPDDPTVTFQIIVTPEQVDGDVEWRIGYVEHEETGFPWINNATGVAR